MITPLMFYAVVMASGNQVQVVDTFHSRQACESASIQAWRYLRDLGMDNVILSCVSTRYQDVITAQKDIEFSKKFNLDMGARNFR